MDKQKEIKLMEERGLVYKGDFIESLTTEEFDNGCIRFNLPTISNLIQLIDKGETYTSCNGEGVFAHISIEDKEKYYDDNFYGEITGILLNFPITDIWESILNWGTEIKIKCNGPDRPIISPSWVKENILDKDWYKEICKS